MSIPVRLSALAALVAVSVLGAPPASAESTAEGACGEVTGVTVVVDSTDLGGDVEVGCAAGDPATGREALEAAGFEPTDAIPGMICAIDARPDPCPEEFEGSYWAYFGAEPGGGWTAQTEGADSVDPAPGSFEGWRYNDGTVGPGITTAELTESTTVGTGEAATSGGAVGTPDEATEASDGAAETADARSEDEAGSTSGTTGGLAAEPGTIASIAVVVVVLGVIAAVTWRRRQG